MLQKSKQMVQGASPLFMRSAQHCKATAQLTPFGSATIKRFMNVCTILNNSLLN